MQIKPIGRATLFQPLTGFLKPGVPKPAEACSYRAVSAGEERGEMFSGVRILLVEDNPTNKMVAAHILNQLGCPPDTAENGREALLLMENTPYDLVFMDAHMPVMDGFTATRRIREMEADRRTPVIAMTARLMPGDLERCLEAGMDDYLSKPIRAEDVYQVLLCHLSVAAVRKLRHAVAFNPDQLLDVSERDEAMIESLVAQYFTDAPGYFSDFRDAVHLGDRAQIHETAHRLKGLVVLTGGEKLGALLHRIENSVFKKDWESDNRMLADVETEKIAFETALKKVDWKTLCKNE